MSATATSSAGQTASFGGDAGQPAAAVNAARISIDNLDFFYGDHRALKGIKLDLPDRQVTA